MSNPLEWSFRVGQVSGIQVRVHWTLPFFMGLSFLPALSYAVEAPSFVLAELLNKFVVFFVFVLLHELGHCHAARRLGGDVDQILLWPLGGLAMVRVRHIPSHEVIVAGAGPLVNVAIGGALALVVGPMFGLAALNPLCSYEALENGTDWLQRLGGGPAVFAGTLAYGLYWSNAVLLAFNLIPAYPLDGGRIFRGLLGFRYSFDRSLRVSSAVGMLFGGILMAVSLIGGGGGVVLFLIGLWVAIEAYRERHAYDMGAFYYDDDLRAWGGRNPYLPAGFEEEAVPEPGIIARWLERRRDAVQRRRAVDEAIVSERLDAVLEKISREGIGSLSDGERRFLMEASRRFKAKTANEK